MSQRLDYLTYREEVESLQIGKRLPDAVYVHRSVLSAETDALKSLVDGIAKERSEVQEWDVAKLFRRDFKVSLLSYPTFFDECYPTLVKSVTVDLVRNKCRSIDYSKCDNPPILHRKELLLGSDHPSRAEFEEITQEGEKAGLYEESTRIGFKKDWERLIEQKGYKLRNGRLTLQRKQPDITDEATDVEIARHRTAIDRNQLSTPMQFLARAGYLDGAHSVFDYGCGKGHDILELEAHGIDVSGWDPAHRPNDEKRSADVVNLGFVINVIEDQDERAEVLREAFRLAKKVMIVAVMLGGQTTTRRFRAYKDGVVTSRNTFQKYYTQTELKQSIEATLGASAVATGPGLFCVFQDQLEEQAFLIKRQKVRRDWRQLTTRDRATQSVDAQKLVETHAELFRDFWTCCLDLGRIPANDEFDRSPEIRRVIGSHRKAFTASSEYYANEDFVSAQEGRIEDLTVFLALSFFDRREAYRRMPMSLQRDIKAFFDKPSVAYEIAKLALFSVADTSKITEACFNAREKMGCGRLQSDHSLVIPADAVPRLPGSLRIFVGCAMQLYGDLDGVNLVKIHMTSGKVSLMIYDDFKKPLPLLQTRVKIRLRDQEIDWFHYDGEYQPQPLYLKTQYMHESDPCYRAQLEFDRCIASVDGIDLSEFGPTQLELNQLFDANSETLDRLEKRYEKIVSGSPTIQ